MACIDANAVQEYLRGHVDEQARARIDEHIDGCDDCRALIAAAATLHVGGAPDPGSEPEPERIGRYRILDRIGAGAMGEIYAAEDPELRRRVALKLLRTRGDPAADARLVREAQALARISHPNVVPVFDVGTHDGRVFLAMELVDGQDLRAWLAERPHAAGEILDVFVAAGRGLSAAHAAGLVHRDFKPDNVLVGADGRVRVTDFGLAQDLTADETADRRALVGTPGYMAPEQLEGAAAGARSDQFSFCVALYEALYGHRPFSGRSLGELRAAMRAGIPDEPRDGAAPPALRRALLRGLALAPDARHPSVDALLAALTHDHARVPRRVAIGALALLAVVVSALAGDAIIRERALGATRARFADAGDQLGHALALRYQTFIALAKVTSVLPVIREIAGNVDKAEFGLGDPAADRRRFAELHENLASADWSMWTRGDRSLIAVADYKGRLIFSTGAPRAFGADLRVLDAVARAYDPEGAGVSAMVIGTDDPALRASGLLQAGARPRVLLVLAGGRVPGAKPRAVFVQAIDGRQLLDDLAPGPGMRLALVAPGGGGPARVVGRVPPGVAARARPGVLEEIGGFFVLARPISGPHDPAPIATILMARRIDVGLEGLFAHARLVLGLLAAALVVVAIAARALAGARRL